MTETDERYDTAVDESSDAEAREQAIDDLEAANECDQLAKLVRADGLDDRYREQALASLAHPACEQTLERLLDAEDLPESLRGRAEELAQETPEDAGDMGRL